MSEPEISRRCPSCGASLRGHALFCPQCGEPLTQPKESSSPTEERSAASSAIEADKSDAQGATAEATAGQKAAEPNRGKSDSARNQDSAGATAPAPGKARKQIQRARTAARGALDDNVRPRVDKIRNASSFVLEEASDDPSLRFVLVAGALFLLFVVLLVLSKVI
ncbi:MAG: zinc ribbon domain-containing protein [Pyrinomonadaceae bacterium]